MGDGNMGDGNMGDGTDAGWTPLRASRVRLSLGAIILAAAIVALLVALAQPAQSATLSCPQGATLNVVAHPDDDLLFLSPDVLGDVQGGARCVRTVFVTAGDNEQGMSYALVREAGIKAAYAQMAGVANSWTTGDAGIAGHQMPMFTLVGKPSISVVFMRLPDGLPDGSGASIHGFESLQKLLGTAFTFVPSAGTISQISAIDASSAYSKATLTATLAALMSTFQPDIIRTQDYVGNSFDHSDHLAVAQFTRAAHASYTAPHVLVGYQGYDTQGRAVNVSGPVLTAKTQAYNAYGAFDTVTCGNPPVCSGSYAAWLERQYTVGSENGAGGGGSALPVADAGPDRTVASGAVVQLGGSGSSVPPGGAVTYTWTQTGGPSVVLSSGTVAAPSCHGSCCGCHARVHPGCQRWCQEQSC